jgi:glycosyltransferase involved in cell wall biosynthesis
VKGLVSVIMPSYNTAGYIGKSIESVLSQTYRDWELIIVDDCSADDTDAAVAPYLSDERIVYLKNERNLGAAQSRNRALAAARGKWIAFLDSDDLWLPEKLEEQIAFMDESGAGFSYTAYTEMNAEGEPLGVTVSGPKHITETGMFRYCWPGCLTVMYDRERVGLIQIADIRKNNDYAMWLKAIRKADCYLLNKPLAVYRRGRSGSVSTHGVTKLIGWHYKLFRKAEGQGAVPAAFNTARNMVFGLFKKLVYVKRTSER